MLQLMLKNNFFSSALYQVVRFRSSLKASSEPMGSSGCNSQLIPTSDSGSRGLKIQRSRLGHGAATGVSGKLTRAFFFPWELLKYCSAILNTTKQNYCELQASVYKYLLLYVFSFFFLDNRDISYTGFVLNLRYRHTRAVFLLWFWMVGWPSGNNTLF